MSKLDTMSTCKKIGWIVGIVAGIFAFWMAWEPVSFVAALLLGLAIAVFLGLVLGGLFCRGAAQVQDSGSVSIGAVSTASATVSAKVPGDLSGASNEDTAPSAQDETAKAQAEADAAEADAKAAAEKAQAESKAKAATKAAEEKAALEAKLEAEEAQAKQAKIEAAKTEKAAKAKTAKTAKKTEIAKAAKSPSKAKKETAAQKAKLDATQGEDYDGDGVREGADEGKKPEGLTAARDGKADDLKQIKGIGPKLETLCNQMGYYHFDQIASWGADEVAYMNANLKGFKGRVSRDTWVDQARLLASGGETEFSKRVEKGSVY